MALWGLSSSQRGRSQPQPATFLPILRSPRDNLGRVGVSDATWAPGHSPSVKNDRTVASPHALGTGVLLTASPKSQCQEPQNTARNKRALCSPLSRSAQDPLCRQAKCQSLPTSSNAVSSQEAFGLMSFQYDLDTPLT